MRSGRQPVTLGVSHGLLLFLLVLGACGRANSAGGPDTFADARPDQVQITSLPVTGDPPSSVTVAEAEVAQALLRAAAALPPAPTEQVCPAIAGPRYELVFFQDGRQIVVATADRGGCPSVTLGRDDTRQANDAFWALLDRDIADATPPARPDRVVVVSFAALAPHQPPTVAISASPARAGQLYAAILALPVLPQGERCPAPAHAARYELAFFAAASRLRATADRGGCGTAQILPGSVHLADEAFWRTLEDFVAGTASAPARPAQLELKVEPSAGDLHGTAHAALIRDANLVQRLYEAAYALPALAGEHECSAPSGVRYGLNFALGDDSGGIELLALLADKGGCGTVDFGEGDVRLADPTFWDLLDRADRA